MFGLGMPEILLIVLVLVLLFGPKRIPELGRGIGQAISSFKKGLRDGERDDADPASTDKKP